MKNNYNKLQKDKDTITLKMVTTIKYKLNGTNVEELKCILHDLIIYAANRGLLTQTNEAEIVSYDIKVSDE